MRTPSRGRRILALIALPLLWLAWSETADAARATGAMAIRFKCALASAGTACLGDYPIAGGAWDGPVNATALEEGDFAQVEIDSGATRTVCWYGYDADDATAEGTGACPAVVHGGSGSWSAGSWIQRGLAVTTISAGGGGFTVDATGNVTAPSYSTAASATPAIELNDSDNAQGTGSVMMNSSGGANAIVGTYGVEDSNGANQTYLTLDGASKVVDLHKPVNIKYGATSGGIARFYEDSDNGTDYLQLKGGDDQGTSPSITFSGSPANVEDLTLTLGANNNTVTWSSSTGVTGISFSALNLVTTGNITGKIPMITKTDDYTLGTDDAQEAYGYMVWISGANKIVTLPAVVAGMSTCVYSTDATAKVVDPNANDGVKNGTAARNADGHKITSGGAAGDFVCLVADSADGWTVLGKSGTWTDE